jgi:hypothetical protein
MTTPTPHLPDTYITLRIYDNGHVFIVPEQSGDARAWIALYERVITALRVAGLYTPSSDTPSDVFVIVRIHADKTGVMEGVRGPLDAWLPLCNRIGVALSNAGLCKETTPEETSYDNA